MKQHPFFEKVRIPIRRSAHQSVILGVLSGFSERFGWPLWATRAGGAILLLCAPSIIDHHNSASFYGGGFFYLLLALLMVPPLRAGEVDPTTGGQTGVYPPPPPPPAGDAASTPGSWVFARRNARRFVPTFSRDRETFGQGTTTLPVGAGGRIDLQALDRQLDSLSRRIARMEGIVTRREDDWDARLRRG